MAKIQELGKKCKACWWARVSSQFCSCQQTSAIRYIGKQHIFKYEKNEEASRRKKCTCCAMATCTARECFNHITCSFSCFQRLQEQPSCMLATDLPTATFQTPMATPTRTRARLVWVCKHWWLLREQWSLSVQILRTTSGKEKTEAALHALGEKRKLAAMPASTAAQSSSAQLDSKTASMRLENGWWRRDKRCTDKHVWVFRVKKKERDGAAGGLHCGCSTVRV